MNDPGQALTLARDCGYFDFGSTHTAARTQSSAMTGMPIVSAVASPALVATTPIATAPTA
jgi:hypothetical protein